MPDVPEVVIADILGMDIVDTDVHVQTCLDIILWHAHRFKILCSFAQRLPEARVITGRHPTPLNISSFLLITNLFFIFADHGRNVLYSFFFGGVIVPGRIPGSVEIVGGFLTVI